MSKSISALLLSLACAWPLLADEHPAYSVRDLEVTPEFIIRDFCLYTYSDAYLMGYSRLLYTGKQPVDYVRLECHFYRRGLAAGTAELYGDYGTYGQSGMRPGRENYFSSILHRTEFDSIAFSISYESSTGMKPLLNKEGLQVLRTRTMRYAAGEKIVGQVRNSSRALIAYPSVLICFYKGGQMVQYQRAFADVPGHCLQPGESATFYCYIDPMPYDEVIYLSNTAVPQQSSQHLHPAGMQTAGNPVLFYLSEI
ncbi:MAG TPA: hypothetical protein PLG50_04670 [bacterium]|nr:hypothetical protein [bacterium]HQG44929.1 hypothetical protein [bacterium]HQI49456.1 hypothetical protein [bacterium]HQJ64393.1 hypothetical protein [bacterium]HQJ65505.1 hypothetical protein [bacterium]